MARPGKGSKFIDRVKGKPVEKTVNGEPVLLKPFSFRQMTAFKQWRADHEKDPNCGIELVRLMVAAAVVDADGNPILDGDDVLDLDVYTLSQLEDHIMSVNGMGDGAGNSTAPTTISPAS